MPITKQNGLLCYTGEEQRDLLPRLRRAAEYSSRKEESRKLRNMTFQAVAFLVLLSAFVVFFNAY